MKHILESFTQIAISNPNISFKLINNGNSFYNLKKSNLKQRIIQLFGGKYNGKILPIVIMEFGMNGKIMKMEMENMILTKIMKMEMVSMILAKIL